MHQPRQALGPLLESAYSKAIGQQNGYEIKVPGQFPMVEQLENETGTTRI